MSGLEIVLLVAVWVLALFLLVWFFRAPDTHHDEQYDAEPTLGECKCGAYLVSRDFSLYSQDPPMEHRLDGCVYMRKEGRA